MIEWQDRTQEVAAEKEIGDLVVAVSDGKLDQRIDARTARAASSKCSPRDSMASCASVSDVVAETRRLVQPRQ